MQKAGLWKGMLNMERNKNNRGISGFNLDLELGKLYAIWLREFKVFLREKSRLVASTFTPLLWLFVLGGGLGSAVSTTAVPSSTSNMDYQEFIFPGIVIMSSHIFFSFFWCIYHMGQKIRLSQKCYGRPC